MTDPVRANVPGGLCAGGEASSDFSDEPSADADSAASDARDASFDELLREVARADEIRSPLRPVSGTVLGRYRILQRLGEGGMGVVYRARDERLERDVALKVLRPGSRPDAQRERLTREATLAAALQHQNVATVFDIGDAEGVAFIAFELIEGRTLTRRISEGLTSAERREFARQLAGALAFIHGSGLVHGDLKPDNVMVDAHGVLKVLDFGLSRLQRPSSAPNQRGEAVEGVRGGTPRYMAPEQRRGEVADARSDVYAFGLILDQMLVARGPRRAGWADRPLKTLSHRCVAEDREQRPADGRAVAALLKRTSRRRDRVRAMWIAATVALSLAVAGASVLARQKAATTGAGDVPPRLEFSRIPLPEPMGPVESLIISPDGTRYFALTQGQPFTLDVASGRADPVPLEKGAAVHAAVWHPDGQSVVALLERSGKHGLYRVSVADGALTHLKEGVLPFFAVSPDGKRIVAIDVSLRVEVLENERTSFAFELPRTRMPFQIAWAPDSSRFALVSIRGWSRREPLVVSTVDVNERVERIVWNDERPSRDNSWASLAWLNDGRILFSHTVDAQESGTDFYLLMPDDNGVPTTPPRHLAQIPGMAVLQLSADRAGERITFISSSPQAKVHWASLKGDRTMSKPEMLGAGSAQDYPVGWYGRDARLLMTSERKGNTSLHAVDVATGQKTLVADGVAHRVFPAFSAGERVRLWAAHADGRTQHLEVAEGDGHGGMRLIDSAGGLPPPAHRPADIHTQVRWPVCAEAGPPRCAVVMQQNDEWVLARIDPTNARLIDTLPLPFAGSTIADLSMSDDGERVLVTTALSAVTLADFQLKKVAPVPLTNGCLPQSIHFLPRGQRFIAYASCFGDSAQTSLFSVDVTTGQSEVLWTPPPLTWPSFLRVSPDGKRLAFTVKTFEIKAWNLSTLAAESR